MSFTQDDIVLVGATLIPVGLSSIIRIKAGGFENGFLVKILAAGGTLEISKPPIALTGSSATGWGTGYPLGASEVYSVAGPATFYLAATGATMTACVSIGYTAGATIGV